MGFPLCSGVLVDRYQAKGTYLLSGGSCFSAGYRAEKNSLCAYNTSWVASAVSVKQ